MTSGIQNQGQNLANVIAVSFQRTSVDGQNIQQKNTDFSARLNGVKNDEKKPDLSFNKGVMLITIRVCNFLRSLVATKPANNAQSQNVLQSEVKTSGESSAPTVTVHRQNPLIEAKNHVLIQKATVSAAPAPEAEAVPTPTPAPTPPSMPKNLISSSSTVTSEAEAVPTPMSKKAVPTAPLRLLTNLKRLRYEQIAPNKKRGKSIY